MVCARVFCVINCGVIKNNEFGSESLPKTRFIVTKGENIVQIPTNVMSFIIR